MIIDLIEELYGPPKYSAPMGRPFSVNKMRGKNLRNSHEYIQWRLAAMKEVMANGPRPAFVAPVLAHCELGGADVSFLADTDNPIKGMLDVAVAMGILPNDTRATVRWVSASWNDNMAGSLLHLWQDTP